jgi:hypothetical protein
MAFKCRWQAMTSLYVVQARRGLIPPQRYAYCSHVLFRTGVAEKSGRTDNVINKGHRCYPSSFHVSVLAKERIGPLDVILLDL